MTIDPSGFPWKVSDRLLAILAQELDKVNLKGGGAILNFRDPDYSAQQGGFHPVEIAISATGKIGYITDFAYIGRPPHSELVKEIDFDATLGLFQHYGHEYLLAQGRELFSVWQENFCDYYAMGVYTVTVERT
jgi:hypothetical protein